MAMLEELKSFLKELNYPEINILEDNEIAKVFSSTNRLYFLTWFAEKWDSEVAIPPNEEDKANTLVEFLYDNGFCSMQDSNEFVKNPSTLQLERQYDIVYRMLYNLRVLSLVDEDDCCEINYVEEMEKMSNLDVNIFPTLGPIQVRDPGERQQKLEQFDQEIKALKKEIEVLNSKYDNAEMHVNKQENTDWNSFDVDKKKISLLMDNCASLLKKGDAGKDCAKFEPTFAETVNNCAKNMADVLKLFQNQKAIGEFSAASLDRKSNQGCENLSETLKHLCLLSQEVLDAE